MPKYYDIIKRELSYEEKYLRALEYVTDVYDEFEYTYKDDDTIDFDDTYNRLPFWDQEFITEFLAKDVFDESVEFKCIKCKKTFEIEMDIFEEIFYPMNNECPETNCQFCSKGTAVPIKVYNEKYNK